MGAGMGSPDALDLQAFLRASAATGRTVLRVPSFTVFLHPRDPLRYLNYAIPDGDVAPDAAAVAALRAAFRERARLPRLEFIAEAAPRLAPALAAQGMAEELRAPLMVCTAAELARPEAAVDDLAVAAVGPGDARAATNVQRVAFGQGPVPPDEEAPDPRASAGGSVLARAGGEAVSAATWTRVIEGTSEVAGVATAEAWRGRGLAGVVTAAAARAAFAAGATRCVISPGHDAAQRIYARAGFREAATMLHWSGPD
jgi:predicted GNAT family acetyltransferase